MSYLEGYGVREARQEKRVRYGIIAFAVILIAATVIYFWQRDRAERLQVESFLLHLRNSDYKAAYALWGCTDTAPCRDYPFNKFMEDWGPASPQSNVSGARVYRSKHCDSGVAQFIVFPDNHDVALWVERTHRTLGFSPYPFPPNNAPPLLRRAFDAFAPCRTKL